MLEVNGIEIQGKSVKIVCDNFNYLNLFVILNKLNKTIAIFFVPVRTSKYPLAMPSARPIVRRRAVQLALAKSSKQHTLGMDILKHLSMRKLSSLPPKTISIIGLSLFQQLCNLACSAAVHLDRPVLCVKCYTQNTAHI